MRPRNVSYPQSLGKAEQRILPHSDPQPHQYDSEAELKSVRAPRKQSLGPVSDFSQEEPGLAAGVPPGLTGDIFKDTELVEAKVEDICQKIKMTEQEKVEILNHWRHF